MSLRLGNNQDGLVVVGFFSTYIYDYLDVVVCIFLVISDHLSFLELLVLLLGIIYMPVTIRVFKWV